MEKWSYSSTVPLRLWMADRDLHARPLQRPTPGKSSGNQSIRGWWGGGGLDVVNIPPPSRIESRLFSRPLCRLGYRGSSCHWGGRWRLLRIQGAKPNMFMQMKTNCAVRCGAVRRTTKAERVRNYRQPRCSAFLSLTAL
jgi:hypothetical protein